VKDSVKDLFTGRPARKCWCCIPPSFATQILPIIDLGELVLTLPVLILVLAL